MEAIRKGGQNVNQLEPSQTATDHVQYLRHLHEKEVRAEEPKHHN
jgi:hypothetical protein